MNLAYNTVTHQWWIACDSHLRFIHRRDVEVHRIKASDTEDEFNPCTCDHCGLKIRRQ